MLNFLTAVKQRKRAIRIADIIINKGNILDKKSLHFNNTKKIIDNKELNKFIQTYIDYRNRLGIKPLIKEDINRMQKEN